MPPDSVMILASFLSQSERSLRTFFQECRVTWLAEQAAAEGDRRQNGLEGVGGEFLRHQADLAARRAILGADVVPVRKHRAFGRVDDAADDRNQRGLAGAIGAEQRKDFAAADVQVDVAQRLEAGSIRLAQTGNGNDRLHGDSSRPALE
jgi:hypothetical protein